MSKFKRLAMREAKKRRQEIIASNLGKAKPDYDAKQSQHITRTGTLGAKSPRFRYPYGNAGKVKDY